MRSLASDNHSGVHPQLMHAIQGVNTGHMASYQTDPISQACAAVWQRHFGPVNVAYVFNGSAANVLALRLITPGHGAVMCSDVAHLNQDAGASPEFMLGCKVQPVPSVDGKLSCALLAPYLTRMGCQHVAQPRALSLTQPTERGTVYTVSELRALCELAHAHNMRVHIDGARLIHAAAYLGCSLRAITVDAGVDVVAFGGTKIGLMGGEAVLAFAPGVSQERLVDLKFVRKQLMQLPSKTRFVAAQFKALLEGCVWQDIGAHGLALAQRLASGLRSLTQVQVLHDVQANMVFASFPKAWVKPLRKHIFFWIWQHNPCVARFVVSFDTTEADVDALVGHMQALSG